MLGFVFTKRTPGVEQRRFAPDFTKIRCPRCAWRPSAHDRWHCAPGCHCQWNTFATAGVCPQCEKEWAETACLTCHQWSPHADWYTDADNSVIAPGSCPGERHSHGRVEWVQLKRFAFETLPGSRRPADWTRRPPRALAGGSAFGPCSIHRADEGRAAAAARTPHQRPGDVRARRSGPAVRSHLA